MEERKNKIKLPALPWRHEMGGKEASLDVADMLGKPVFDPAHPYDEEVETTKFIVHAANAIFALAEQESKNPLEAAIDLEMRIRNVTRGEVVMFSEPRKNREYLRRKMWNKCDAERKYCNDKELALK